MGLLNPLWLLLGAAVAVPLILHLLQRHQGPRVIFPAVRYLRRAEREHARRIKLRQLLLLLLRVAALLLLAFAAARPFLRSAGVSHEPTAAVIILDNSMSSSLVRGDRRVLDELKARVAWTLDFIRSVSPDRLAGAENRTIVHELRTRTITLPGLVYVTQFSLPNFCRE